ncbi:ClpA/ClpB-like protein [Micromonospora sp. Llam0]|uniref:Clp protease N-terminal domain-containing protein n=1 Tax=Micromonospora sp. Llam0 TaxID=2485143 RepID=UPI000FB385EF|nr:Clp protease N-terminal domain-containing protein [Micromonospora sp. Llam0]ROO60262.1 ClpA/ClpB-like protein [Micromonospora sp. Llam0]
MTGAGDRYGTAAQAVVDAAYAVAAHRPTVPTCTTVDDLLVALRTAGDPVVAPVLAALGVPEQPIPGSAPVHRPADANLVRVLLTAASVAGRFGAAGIEPVHLLLAALREPDGELAAARTATGSTVEQVRRRTVGGYLGVRGLTDALDAAAGRAVVDAGVRAGRAGATETGPDHLLLALATGDEPGVAEALSVLAAHDRSPAGDPDQPARLLPLSTAGHEALAWAMCLLVDGDDTTDARSAPPTIGVADLARALLDQAAAAGSAVLDRHGVDPRRLRADVDRRSRTPPPSVSGNTSSG